MVKFYLFFRALFPVLLLCGSTLVMAQNKVVTGTVLSGDDNSALPGVSIVEKGTSNGAVTDSNGTFSIKVSDNATLVFSFVGYASQEVAVGSQTVVNVTLLTDVTALSEVVIIGYGQQEKKDVTGSIAALGAKDFNKGVLTSPQDLMVGRIAGVSVISNSGAPGAGSTIRIRGGSSLNANNDPLIIVDGFPLDNNGVGGTSNPLSSINPNDIESFTVLKDASATAIYGLRASNGVIIITTKKGKEGKPQLQYSGTVSLSQPAKLLDVLSADEYRTLVTDLANEGSVSGLDPADLVRLGESKTDWQDQIYRDAISQDHLISLAGSYKNLPYRVSYGYTNQQGILENTDVKRHSINVSLTPTFFDDNLKVTANLKTSFSENNFGNQGAVGNAINFAPTQPVMNGNTRYGGYFTWTLLDQANADGTVNPDADVNYIAPSNPVALINQTDNVGNVNRYLGNIQLDYRLPFLPDLRVNVNAGLDILTSDGNNNQPDNAAFTFRNGPGNYVHYTGDNRTELFDLYLNYTKGIGLSRIDATAGYSFQSFTRDATTITKNGAGKIIDGIDSDSDGENDGPRITKNPNDLLSLFGRVNYSYDDKYFVSATLRNDYSSRFSEDNRSGLFPAVSVGWSLKKESFLQDVKDLSTLKLRAGYGVTGQQDISSASYPYLPLYTESTSTARYEFGGVFYNTLRPNPYDDNIKWEETTTINIAADFGFIDDRIKGSVDFYNRETQDLINFIPVAAGSNFSNFLTTNVGNLENKGFEVTLSADLVSKSDFVWNVGVNYAHNTNEITKLRKIDDPTYPGVATGGISGGVGNNIQIHSVGYPANSFYVFQQVYDADGKPIEGLYVDRTGEGGSVTSNENNKYHAHNPVAQHLIGINSRLNYKQFDFSFSSRLSLGNYVYNNIQSSNGIFSGLYNQSGYFNNIPAAALETNFHAQQLFSDYYIEDASFFKLDNISAGYTVNRLLTEKLKARFSLTVQNALVISDYSGNDPEVVGGIDNNIYPRPRTFLFGISLTY